MPLQDVRDLSAGLSRFFAERHQRLREIKSAGKKNIGYFCSYTPEELILAAGMHPIRILADPAEQAGPVDAHLQTFSCAFARSCLDQLLRGRLDYLDGIVFPCTCDSLRAVSEITRSIKQEGFFNHFLNMPLRLDGDLPRAYYLRELAILYRALADFNGRQADDQSLEKAIELADANRGLLKGIWDCRRVKSPPLSGEVCLGLVNAAVSMDRQEVRGELEKISLALAADPGKDDLGPGPVRLMVIGSVIDNPALLGIIEQSGACVVADDLCTGTRYFTGAVGRAAAEGPLEALARRYLERVPCPTKHPAGPRLDHLSRLLEDFRVQGVVMVLQKFCEPHAFDYPMIRDHLSARGLPVLLLEVEPAHLAAGQLSTRVQAFVEMLGGGL